MNIKLLREVIKHNIQLDENDGFAQQECWQKMIKILSEDIGETINYLRNECTDEEFFWISSVFDDVAEITQSWEFIKALRARLASVTYDQYDQNAFESKFMRKHIDYNRYMEDVNMDIDYAEEAILDKP